MVEHRLVVAELSKRFALSRTDWQKIGKGAIIAVVGALLAYFSDVVLPSLNENPENKLVLAPVLMVLLNVIRKWLVDYSNVPVPVPPRTTEPPPATNIML